MVWRGAGRGVCARAGVGASGSAVGEREGRRRAGCVNKNSQNKQFRIRCVPFHSFLRIVFALLKINGFANKSEFVVQPKSSELPRQTPNFQSGLFKLAKHQHRKFQPSRWSHTRRLSARPLASQSRTNQRSLFYRIKFFSSASGLVQ